MSSENLANYLDRLLFVPIMANISLKMHADLLAATLRFVQPSYPGNLSDQILKGSGLILSTDRYWITHQ